MNRTNTRMMPHTMQWVAALLFATLIGATANAAYPPPANDTPATAELVGPLPAILVGANVLGDDTISITTLGALPAVPGPDVFYSFTPAATGDYWIVMIPWIEVPVYASSGGTVPVPNLCVYIREAGSGSFITGSDANSRGRPDSVVTTLTGGVEYEIVVDSTETAARAQEFEFTLIVADAPAGSREDCAAPGFISNDLPTVAVGTLTGAIDDVSFVEGAGRCDVADPFGTFIPGVDNVFEFTTGADPNDAGDYAITLVPHGIVWDGFVYVVDSCPPFYPVGCLGAASHTNSTTRQAETIVVTLDYDTTYYVVVDAATFSLPDAKYTLLIDHADAWGINESESNDSPVSAKPLAAGPNGGQIVGGADEDFWTIFADPGDKLFAFVDNGNTLLSTIDSELRLYDVDGGTLIEFDDDDGEGSTSPVATLVHRSSAFSATIAGATLFTGGDYYLQVNSLDAFSTIARYFLHYGLIPADRAPAPECEPNGELGLADASGKDYFAGVIDADTDEDFYAFEATAGETIYIGLDGDPERNSGGDEDDDALALDAALRVYDPDGDLLIDNHDDVNTIGAGQTPDYPAEALAFVAPLSGTYAVVVRGSDVTDFGPGRTYELAIFRDNATPALIESLDPVIDSITPDFGTDTLTVEASDDAVGDSGMCDVTLAPGSVNLVLSDVTFTPGDPTITFAIGLDNPGFSGSGKLIVIDCAGNTACAAVEIDAGAPSCTGSVVTPGTRTYRSTHAPLHAPDNQPAGPGIDGEITIPDSGTIADVNVTLTVESARIPDVDVFLESPAGTRVDVVSDAGSISDYSITDATFDDSAEEQLTFFGDEPYTATWLPDDPNGLAQFNGENVLGTWKLNVIDDSNSASGGSRLVRWSLEIDAGFPSPEQFDGNASDTGGVASVVLSGADNVQLNLPDSFTPGDLSVDYTVTLINPSLDGSGTITVTDISDNTCIEPIALNGLPDTTRPANTGAITRNLEFGAEAQLDVMNSDPDGVISSITIPDAALIGQVIVDLTIDTRDVGRLASTLSHGAGMASLINRVGMDERGSVGLTKDGIEITLDDDAPAADDAHEEPALGSIEFLGLHQPDGRGEFIGDGITDDYRDNMLFDLAGEDVSGQWDLMVGDFRVQTSSTVRSIFRRWHATVIAPAAPERYVGHVVEAEPQSGLCSIALAGGATNLALSADFTPFDREADYVVSLVDPNQAGSGTVEITDCAGNVTQVPVSLAAALADQNLPVITGGPGGFAKFEGTATELQPGDSGIASVALAPYAENLELAEVTPDPPNGATSVDFVVSLVDGGANGRGYIQVTDQAGFRSYILVEIDEQDPICTGSVGRTKRYRSGGDLPADLPDDSPAGATSSIVVPDPDVISDLDITINITHGFDDDIDLTIISPTFLALFSDIGLTGNDFIDTVLDDEAAAPIPDSSSAAPFTGSYQPEPPAMLSVFDGNPAFGTYTLQAVDDAIYNVGTFESWALTIESPTFPMRYDGRVEDGRRFDGGICTIELAPGASNVVLDVDPFDAGDAIVRYCVELANPAVDGTGTVIVTDCAGNTCGVAICLAADIPPGRLGDFDGDGDVDNLDFDLFAGCMNGPQPAGLAPCDPCRFGDFDDDDDVDTIDFAAFQQEFATP